MARIRSVKPEFWSDQKLATRSRDARLLYISLWNFADEQARMVGDPRQVKGLCLPMDDDLGPKEIDVLLDELADIGRVVRYTVDGEHFLFLPHLAKHQRLDAQQESRYPEPPDDPASTPHESGDSPEKFGEVHSDPGEVRPHARAYVAGSREQGAGGRLKPSADAIRAVFDAWVSSFPDATRRDLTDARRDAILAALERYPQEDVVDAACGWVNDPWPERAQQNDLAQLLHMGTRRKPHNTLEKMRDLCRRGPPQAMGRQTRQMADNAAGLRHALQVVEGGRAIDG